MEAVAVVCLEAAGMSPKARRRAAQKAAVQSEDFSAHVRAVSSVNLRNISFFDDQALVLRLAGQGVSVDDIVARLNSRKGGKRVQAQVVIALIERGVPLALPVAKWQCPGCRAKLVTDYCLACWLRGERHVADA